MAKCSLCSTKKGKRYCSPLEKVICPKCCAENRAVKITCNDDCRYLEKMDFQKKRSEEKEFSTLMGDVGHGQHDDIFQQSGVASMAFEVESFVGRLFLDGELKMTDTGVYEAYKTVYAIHYQGKVEAEVHLDDLTQDLLQQFKDKNAAWKKNLDQDMIGKVYLRLMISVKAMSGGRFGEYGYLNYLKNNLATDIGEGEFIMEDKFGSKTIQTIDP